MNFQLTSFGFLLAICAVADAIVSTSTTVGQSSQCDSVCPMKSVSDYIQCRQTQCTSTDCDSTCSAKMKSCCTSDVDSCMWDCLYNCTRDLQTMCQTLSILSASEVVNIGTVVDIALAIDPQAECQNLINADVTVVISSPTKAGCSQCESLLKVVIGVVTEVKIPLMSNSIPSLASVILEVIGTVVSGGGSSSGTGCSQNSGSLNVVDICIGIFASLGLSDDASKSLSNDIIGAVIALQFGGSDNNSISVSAVADVLANVSGINILDVATDVVAVIVNLGGGTSSSGPGCSGAGDNSSIVDIIAEVLLEGGVNQSDCSSIAALCLNAVLNVGLIGTGLVEATARIGVTV